jgi:hypothetical protein
MHFPFSVWGVGDRWWQPCPSLAIPHVHLGCRSLNCHMRLLADQYSVASWPISCLVLTLNHIYVWSLAVLGTAILDCLLRLGTFFYSLFSLLSLRLALVCHTILNLSWLTHVLSTSLLCSHVILSMSVLETFTWCLSLGKYKWTIPEYFQVKCYNDRSMCLRINSVNVMTYQLTFLSTVARIHQF